MKVFSGQTTVAASGTAVVLGSQDFDGLLMLKAPPENTGVIYVGNNGSGSVNSLNGMPLSAGDALLFEGPRNLNEFWVNTSVGGSKVAWLISVSEGMRTLTG